MRISVDPVCKKCIIILQWCFVVPLQLFQQSSLLVLSYYLSVIMFVDNLRYIDDTFKRVFERERERERESWRLGVTMYTGCSYDCITKYMHMFFENCC